MTTTLQAPAGTPRRPGAPRRRWPHRVVPAGLLLLGILVLLYPVGATVYNNTRQRDFARDYSARVSSADSTMLADQLARAEAYNAALPPGLLHDPWGPATAAGAPAYRAYLGQLDQFDAMARIRIPAIGVDLPVLHGTSEQTLARGIGHLFGSSLPVGGDGTDAVLTGHSSLANATMFDHLDELRPGDRFFIDVYGRTLAYEVDRTLVVLPTELDSLVPVTGRDDVTLVTCTPYAVNSHRLLVRGHRVALDPAAGHAVSAARGGWRVESWMWPRLGGAALALLTLLAMATGWVRSDRRRRRRATEALEPGPMADATTDHPIPDDPMESPR